MSDRELLEFAAKAAGWFAQNWAWVEGEGFVYQLDGRRVVWNPLDDDGDALRLAVKLKMELIVHERLSCAAADGLDGFLRRSEHHKGDPDAATRRAIVRAAARAAEHAEQQKILDEIRGSS